MDKAYRNKKIITPQNDKFKIHMKKKQQNGFKIINNKL